MKNPPYNLIVFTAGLKSGKTAAAAVAERAGYQRVRFAAPLKDMLVTMGLTRQQVEVDKEIPCDLLGGATPRRALQLLGTEFGRAIDESLWTRIAEYKIRDLLAAGKTVVVDDCRFDNEAEMLSRLGAVIVRIERDALKKKRSWFQSFLLLIGVKKIHASERGISDRHVDVTIKNNGTLQELKDRVTSVLNGSYFVSAQVYDAVLELQMKAACHLPKNRLSN